MSSRIVIAAFLFVTTVAFAANSAANATKTPVDYGCKVCKCPDCPNNAKRPPVIAQQPAPQPKAANPDPMSFEEALRDQIESRPETIRSRRILAVLDMEPGPRRERILHRMERHAITHLDLKGEVGAIDWSSIDWAKVFDMIMKLLAALLPLLLAI